MCPKSFKNEWFAVMSVKEITTPIEIDLQAFVNNSMCSSLTFMLVLLLLLTAIWNKNLTINILCDGLILINIIHPIMILISSWKLSNPKCVNSKINPEMFFYMDILLPIEVWLRSQRKPFSLESPMKLIVCKLKWEAFVPCSRLMIMWSRLKISNIMIQLKKKWLSKRRKKK